MAIKYINNWQAELIEPISTMWESLPIPNDKLVLLGDIQEGDEYRITLTDGALYEVVSLFRPAGSQVFMIERGKEGTKPSAWPSGTKVFAGVTAGMLAAISAKAHAPIKAVAGQSILIDPSLASVWTTELTSDATVTLSEADKGVTVKILVEQDGNGGHYIQWPDKVRWDAEYSHGMDSGQVTLIDLISLGGGAWGGKPTIYDRGTSNETFYVERYAFAYVEAYEGEASLGDLFISYVNGNQHQTKRLTAVTRFHGNGGASAESYVKVSPDGQHLVFVLYGSKCDIYSTKTWDKISVTIPRMYVGPAILELQLRGGFAYGFEEGVGIYRINLDTGARENTGLLPDGIPQSISVSDSELIMTLNQTTSYVTDFSTAIARYDLDTLTLSAEQYDIPADATGVFAEGSPSPMGISGRHSPDGSHFAVCDQFMYEEGGYQNYFRIYSTETSAPIVELDYQGGSSEFEYSPVWSQNGRYCGFATTLNTLHIYDMTTESLSLIPVVDEYASNIKLVLTNDGYAVIQANSDKSNLKPFATYSIATGAQVNDWAAAIYAGATDFGFTLGSNS